MKKFFTAAAAATALLCGASAANAVTLFNDIDQPTLDTFGTEFFGATTDELGVFTHMFTFTTSVPKSSSASVITISLTGGSADIDFSAIDLDGIAFEQHGFDPDAESWDLNLGSLGAGMHTITLHGEVVSAPASYSGTLNLGAAVPEPGTWALMIMGFGGAGAMLRRRRTVVA